LDSPYGLDLRFAGKTLLPQSPAEYFPQETRTICGTDVMQASFQPKFSFNFHSIHGIQKLQAEKSGIAPDF